MGEPLSIVINAFAVNASSHNIPSITLKYSAKMYEEHVKHFLETLLNDPRNPVIYVTKKINGTFYMTHITGLNVEVAGLSEHLGEVKSHAESEEQSSIILYSQLGAHILNRAFFKKMLSSGWICDYRYGYYRCYREDEKLGEDEIKQISAPWLFTFYREYVFKVIPIEKQLYFVIEPRLYVKGADFKDLIEKVGLERIKTELEKKKEGIECIAYRDSEQRYRGAIVEDLKDTANGLMVRIIYFDGEPALIKPDKVRLKGNVLHLKSFISRIFGEVTYNIYSRLQRCYSFSLGTKESQFKTALEFNKEVAEFISRIRRDRIIPFIIGGVSINLNDEPVKVEVITYEL